MAAAIRDCGGGAPHGSQVATVGVHAHQRFDPLVLVAADVGKPYRLTFSTSVPGNIVPAPSLTINVR